MPDRALIVDDDANTRRSIASIARKEGWETTEAATAVEALEELRRAAFDLVLCDLVLPGIDGIELLRRLRSTGDPVAFVVITGHASLDSALEALRLGAADYLSKPVRLNILRSVLEKIRRRRSGSEGEAESGPRLDGESAAIGEVRRLIDLAAPGRSTVLLTGETGTGKEIAAELLHRKSPRAGGPLVKVNCAGLPDNLIESELFGHERGAFTGAERARAGRFELANGGTIFLDEVADMSWSSQSRLLRVLQMGEFEPVGSSITRKTDVRVIAATNQDLRKLAAEKRFREDLYYRLHVIEIHIPPLRDRREDMPILVQSFLERLAALGAGPVPAISAHVWRLLQAYAWPGNVRELEHVLEHAYVLSGGRTIEPDHLPAEIRPERPRSVQIQIGTSLERAEREIIRQTLKAVGDDKREAARILGLSRSALYRRLDDLKRGEAALDETEGRAGEADAASLEDPPSQS
jgi:two-component system response regulator AtoC